MTLLKRAESLVDWEKEKINQLFYRHLTKTKLNTLSAELKNSSGNYINLLVKPSSFPHHIDELLLEPEYNHIC
jgi:hypothetical protein